MSSYKNYLKYKKKYLNLKNNFIQKGSGLNDYIHLLKPEEDKKYIFQIIGENTFYYQVKKISDDSTRLLPKCYEGTMWVVLKVGDFLKLNIKEKTDMPYKITDIQSNSISLKNKDLKGGKLVNDKPEFKFLEIFTDSLEPYRTNKFFFPDQEEDEFGEFKSFSPPKPQNTKTLNELFTVLEHPNFPETYQKIKSLIPIKKNFTPDKSIIIYCNYLDGYCLRTSRDGEYCTDVIKFNLRTWEDTLEDYINIAYKNRLREQQEETDRATKLSKIMKPNFIEMYQAPLSEKYIPLAILIAQKRMEEKLGKSSSTAPRAAPRSAPSTAPSTAPSAAPRSAPSTAPSAAPSAVPSSVPSSSLGSSISTGAFGSPGALAAKLLSGLASKSTVSEPSTSPETRSKPYLSWNGSSQSKIILTKSNDSTLNLSGGDYIAISYYDGSRIFGKITGFRHSYPGDPKSIFIDKWILKEQSEILPDRLNSIEKINLEQLLAITPPLVYKNPSNNQIAILTKMNGDQIKLIINQTCFKTILVDGNVYIVKVINFQKEGLVLNGIIVKRWKEDEKDWGTSNYTITNFNSIELTQCPIIGPESCNGFFRGDNVLVSDTPRVMIVPEFNNPGTDFEITTSKDNLNKPENLIKLNEHPGTIKRIIINAGRCYFIIKLFRDSYSGYYALGVSQEKIKKITI